MEDGLAEVGITIGMKWSKSRRTNELNKILVQMKPENIEISQYTYPTILMMQDPQVNQELSLRWLKNDMKGQKLEIIGLKLVETKIVTKSHLSEKLERDVDCTTFLQWEKSLKLYEISSNLKYIREQQQTYILFSFFVKNCLMTWNIDSKLIGQSVIGQVSFVWPPCEAPKPTFVFSLAFIPSLW